MKRKCLTGVTVGLLLSGLVGGAAVSSAATVKCTWASRGDGKHRIIQNEPAVLKAVVDSESTNITYSWNFGDGSPNSPEAAAADPYSISIEHTYTGGSGTIYTATITVWDVINEVKTEIGADTYTMEVRSDSSKTRKKIAIEDGLWYLHSKLIRSTNGQGIPVGEFYNDYKEGTVMDGQAFVSAGFLATGSPDNPYTDDVQRIINFTIDQLTVMNVNTKDGANGAEDRADGPVGLKDGLGVAWLGGELEYGIGNALRLIATSGYTSANAPAATHMNSWNYVQIAQQMIDYIAWAQLVECSNDYSTFTKVLCGTPVANPGGWPYWSEGWGDVGGDVSVSRWTVSGLMAAENEFSLPYPTYIKPGVASLLANNQLASGTFVFGLDENFQLVERAGAGLILMDWLGFGETANEVVAAKNFISANWEKNNYETNQSHDSVCSSDDGDPQCFTHIELDVYEAGYFDANGVWIPEYYYDKLNLYGMMVLSQALDTFEFDNVPASGAGWNERYLDLLLNNQFENGAWDDNNWGDGNTMGTGWAIHTLLTL